MIKSKHITGLNKLFIYTLFIVCVYILLSPIKGYGQTQSETGLPFITNYSPKIYKAYPQTWCVQEDESGIMYFGIQSYILEYDGVKWNKIPLLKSAVRSMAMHKDGLIYFGGFTDLGYLDNDSLGQKKAYTLFDHIPAENRNFLDVWTTHSTESGIYFQAREYIFRLEDKKPGTNEKRKVKVWKPATKFMYAFYIDNNYYVHQQGLGLFKMVNDSLVLIPGSEFLGKERMQIMLPYKTATNEKQYLIGMFYGGLYLFNGTTFQSFSTKADPIIKSGSLLYKGLLLKNGNYALSTTGKGLVIIDAQGNLLQKINREVGLQDESVYANYQDKKGTLWLGLDNGISRIETASPLTQFTLQSGINTGVLNITRFDGNLYIGTTNGLLVYNNKTSFFDPVPGIVQNQIFTLLPDGKQLLVPGDGLFAVRDKKTIVIKESVSADLTLSGLYISKKYPNILFGGGTFGVAAFIRTSGNNISKEPPSWQFAGYVPGITDQIWSFSENIDGTIWAGTQSGRVYKIIPAFNEMGDLDLSKTKFEKYGADHGFKDGTGQVYNIKGVNYFFAENSLYTFDEQKKLLIPDSTFGNFKNGGGNTEYEMVEDQQGRVWIRFGKTTRLAIPKPEGGYRFDDSQLSTIKELTIQKIYPESNGIVWVCTTDGLIRYDENLEKNVEQSYKTVIRFASAGKNLLSTVVAKDSKPVSVSYKNNILRFEYAAPFFEQEDKTQYQTWLEGFEKDWSDFGFNYYKEYTNIPAGDYHFHVRAKNVFQKLSEEAVYHFSIFPPWYATWWAYTLYALAAIAIIYSFIRWRTKQLHEKHRELEKIVEARTHELKQRAEELSVINSVQEGLASKLDIQAIYDLVGDKIRDIFDTQGIAISYYDRSSNFITHPYDMFKGKRVFEKGFEMGKGLISHIVHSGQPLLINENANERFKELGAVYSSSASESEHDTSKSWLGVPLISGGKVNGTICLENYEKEFAYSEADVSLLQTLANSMSVALENARLFDETKRLLKETEQRTAELAVINSVQEGLAKELDIQGIYDMVGERIRNLFDAQIVVIRTFDHEAGIEHWLYVIEKGERFYNEPSPFMWANKQLINSKEPLLINKNYLETSKKYGGSGVAKGLPPKSALFVPMMLGDVVKGSISLQNIDRENAFTESDLRLLTTLTNSMSVALENARLFDETTRLLKETEQRTAELSVINSVQDGLARELDIHGIYKLVGDRLCSLFPETQTLVIRTFNYATNQEYFEYFIEKGEHIKVDPRPFMWANNQLIQTKKSLLINEDYVETAKKFGGTGVTKGQPPKSAVFVPMIVGEIVRGSISLQNVDKEFGYSESDLRLLTTLTNSMSVALENARLFDETNRLLKETEQRKAELAVINSVQEGLVREIDMQAIYDLVGNRLYQLFTTTNLVIRTFDHESGKEYWRYAIEKGQRQYIEPKPFIWANKQLIQSKKPIHINENYVETSRKYGGTGVTIGQPPKSAVFVPMIVGDVVKGSVSLQNVDKENAYTEADLRLLTTLTNSMSVALENARLFDETNRLLKETEQRTAELAVINSVQEGLAKELDIQGIYDLVGDRIIKVFNAPNLVIRTFDLETGLENWRYAVEKGERQYIKPKPFVWHSKQIIQNHKPIHINENYLETSKKFGGTGQFVGQATKSGIFVPMMVGGIIKGSVSLQNVDKEFAYNEADLRLLTTITNSMSVALENARLFDETNRLLKETEQRTAELAVINSVQEGLAKELDMHAIYNLVGDRLCDLFPDTQTLVIRTFDHVTKLEHFQYAIEKGVNLKVAPRPFMWANKELILTKRPIDIRENYVEVAKQHGGTGVTTGQPPKSAVFVPMMVGDIVKGSISLQNVDRENAFSDSDLRLLATLTNSMSVALENARLFDETNRLLKETEQRTAELAVINSVQDGLAKELDMMGIYNLVGDRLCELFPDSQTLVIRTFDHDNGLELWQYAREKGVRQYVEPRPLNWNSKLLIQTKKALDIKENYVETSKKHGGTGVTAGQPPKSAVFVPMMLGDIVKGTISLQNVDKENAFNDADLRLLTTITNSMSVALENARLFDETNRLLKETEQRTGELAVINSVQEGLVREMDMQAIYDLVGNRICMLFDTQTVLIRTFDHEKDEEIWRFVIEKGERLYSKPRPYNWANKQLIKSKQPLLINEKYVETAMQYGGTGVSKGLPPKSAMFVPMIVGEVVRGSVSLQNIDKENAFTESDLRLLTTITNSMSVALENARLFDETTVLLAESKQRAAELGTVNNISKALASQLDPDDLIKMVGDQLKNLFKANIVYLALLDSKTKIINFPYQYGDNMAPLKLGEGLTSKIIMTGEPILINKDLSEVRKKMGIQLVGLESASYLGVPIPVGEKNIGVLSVQSTVQENSFNENDLRLLSTIASSVGVALNNATLFEDVQQAKMEAETASKLAERANEAKSAFLSTVSHELRTPLTSVLGFAKIIKKRLEERIFPLVDKSDTKIEKAVTQVSENLHVVISEGTRLTHLINDVLDLAKIEAGKMEFAQENVSMSDVAERAIAATTSLFEQKSLKLIRKIDTDLPDVIGDKDKLIQVMINLISNSVKFTDAGSITCTVKKVDNEIIASIKDTGIGIAMDDYGAVFEQFKQVGGDTLTDKPKGTGLGLPICKEIVEHLGGRIWLESEVGKGSIFSFALPINKSVPAERPIHLNDLVKQLKEQVASSKLNITGLASTILIVDDDDSIRSLLHQELGDAGYLIIEAKNGKEALDCVRKQRPDLIILDIMMPEMNGFDVAAVLKNDPNTMDIPIIVLSVVQDKARGFRIGVDRYLTKPIDTGILFSEVGSLLEQGNSKKKVLIVDEDTDAVKTLSEVLKAKGYEVSESKEKELVSNAISSLPDIIIINSLLSGKQDIVQTLRFEKGLENVLFVVYQ